MRAAAEERLRKQVKGLLRGEREALAREDKTVPCGNCGQPAATCECPTLEVNFLRTFARDERGRLHSLSGPDGLSTRSTEPEKCPVCELSRSIWSDVRACSWHRGNEA